ncbi:MAG: DUF4345 domain-containing protein [Ginsengibacter sp.]
MELTIKILLGIVSLICFLGGINLLLKGANSFLPENTPPQRILDNLFRFLSGIYFSMAFLIAWVIFHFQHETDLIYFLGIPVIFSGLGRLYSRVKVGSAGKYFDNIMIFEIALGTAIILLQYFR